MYEKGPLPDRYALADHCNSLGLVGWAIEIGTDRGHFACQFLKRWTGHYLACVDPYTDGFAGYEKEMRWPRLPDLMIAAAALSQFNGRARIIQLDSRGAAEVLHDVRPHFVYIDANHAYEFVKTDIEIWYPKLRQGGLIAGHDFHPDTPGVIRAVEEFFNPKKIEVLLTNEQDGYFSWYARKPG